MSKKLEPCHLNKGTRRKMTEEEKQARRNKEAQIFETICQNMNLAAHRFACMRRLKEVIAQKDVEIKRLNDQLGRAATEANEALTLEELRDMDGEPVWVQTPGVPEYGRWGIVARVDTRDREQTLYCQSDYTCRNYGKTWLAYRRPPEGGNRPAQEVERETDT